MGEGSDIRLGGVRAVRPNRPRMLRVAPLWLCLLIGGCASAVEGPLYFSDAGKYQYHNCDQLAAAAKTHVARERELKQSISRSLKNRRRAAVVAREEGDAAAEESPALIG